MTKNMSRIAPERSSFARTCNMLSHYLKEKGSPLDLTLGVNANVETFPVRSQAAAKTTIDFLSEKPSQFSTHDDLKLLNLFPQCIGTQDSTAHTNSRDQVETEHKNAQMRIFCWESSMEYLMQLASNVVTPTTSHEIVETSVSNFLSISEFVGARSEIERPLQPMTSDLPLARRASLQKFFSKRKERAIARAAYQLKKPSAESGKQLLFDLNL